MPELGNTNLKIIGVPKVEDNKVPDEYLRPQVWASIDEEEKKKRQGILLEQLSPEEQQQFAVIETAAGNLIKGKLGRLKIEAPTINPVIYATNPKTDYREGYYDPLVGAVLYANRPVETFDKYSTIAHAVSHLATKNQVRQYLSQDDANASHRTWTSGAEVVGNKKPLVGALEEGMVTMDQVDFFNFYLQINHPEEYARRRQASESKDIKKQAEKSMSKRLYGDISPLTIAPFVVFEVHNHMIRKGTKIKAVLDVVGLKQYLFARKMCEVLGRSLVPDEIIGQEKAIQLGRDLIDRDRYLGTGDAHRRIVEAMGSALEDPEERSRYIHEKNPDARGLGRIGLGGIRARTIFAAKANDEKSIDEAMPMPRYIVPKVKPLVDPKAPPAPNLSKLWAEALPVKPIEADQPIVKNPDLVFQGETLEPQIQVRPAQIETAPSAPADVVEEMVGPITPPAPESPAPTPRVEVREVAPAPAEDPQLGYFQSQLQREEGRLTAAEERLAEILASHPEREMEFAAAERLAIERYKRNIEGLNSRIAQRTPAEIEKQKEEIASIKQLWRKSLSIPTTPDQNRLIDLGAHYMSYAKGSGGGRLYDLFYRGELHKDDYERITLSRENHLFFADFATYLLNQPNPNPGYISQLVYLIWDLDMALGGENAYEGKYNGQGKFLHPDFNRLVTSIRANLPEVAERLLRKPPKNFYNKSFPSS